MPLQTKVKAKNSSSAVARGPLFSASHSSPSPFNAISVCSAVLSRKVVQLKQNSCHKGTQRAQGQEFIFFSFCDLCDLSWQFIFGCGLPRCALLRPFPAPKKISKNSALFPPVGFSPSWKYDQLRRVSTNLPIALADRRAETAACPPKPWRRRMINSCA